MSKVNPDIVDLGNYICPCGWMFPRGLTRVYRAGFDDSVHAAEVGFEFRCPKCNKEFEMFWDNAPEKATPCLIS